jgi:hypothetical protein
MPKFELLLLDANIVIYLHELGLWRTVIERCTVTLTQTVVDEVKYLLSADPAEVQDSMIADSINLQTEIQDGKIQCTDVLPSIVREFKQRFDPSYLDKLDPGEVESLTLLFHSSRP